MVSVIWVFIGTILFHEPCIFMTFTKVEKCMEEYYSCFAELIPGNNQARLVIKKILYCVT